MIECWQCPLTATSATGVSDDDSASLNGGRTTSSGESAVAAAADHDVAFPDFLHDDATVVGRSDDDHRALGFRFRHGSVVPRADHDLKRWTIKKKSFQV